MSNIPKLLSAVIKTKDGGIIVRDINNCLYLVDEEQIREEVLIYKPVKAYRLFSPNINRRLLTIGTHIFKPGSVIICAAKDGYVIVPQGESYSAYEMLYALEHVDVCTFVFSSAAAKSRILNLQKYISTYKHTYCSYKGGNLSAYKLEQAKVIITLSKVNTCFNTFGKGNDGICVSINMYYINICVFSAVIIGSVGLHGPFYLDGEFRLPINKVADITKFFVPLMQEEKKAPSVHQKVKVGTTFEFEAPDLYSMANNEDDMIILQHDKYTQQFINQVEEFGVHVKQEITIKKEVKDNQNNYKKKGL